MATIERPTTYAPPGQPESPVPLLDRYDNFIGGAWVPPADGEYRENLSPATGDPSRLLLRRRSRRARRRSK